ncbi:MAG: SPOR domain-containing protein [Inhella sp.]
MGLLSFLRRQSAPAASAPAASGRKRANPSAVQVDAAEHIQRLRQQARHRLIGAAVLVGVGIVAFPLVFETQPRPVPMDLPIVIPSQDRAGPLADVPARVSEVPASLPAAARAEAPAPAPVSVPEPAEEVPESTPAPAAARLSAQPAVAPTVAPAPAPARQAPSPAKAESPGRYVVQVGAFADQKSAQDARQRLERKGLRTYTQVAKTGEGDRIRVRLGPFDTKADADKAAAAAQAVGLPGKVLTL